MEEALEDVSLTGMSRRYPNELSGGQRQRVAVARALVNRPKLLLLDEPLAALDAKLKESMQLELITLQKEVGITFVYVTHDQQEALALSHRIAVMNQGRVEQLDEPSKIYGFPKNRFVADFIGTCNILDAEVLRADGERMRLRIAGLGEVDALQTDSVGGRRQGRAGVAPRAGGDRPAAAARTRTRTASPARCSTSSISATSPSTWWSCPTAGASRRCCPIPHPAAPSSSRPATPWRSAGATTPGTS